MRISPRLLIRATARAVFFASVLLAFVGSPATTVSAAPSARAAGDSRSDPWTARDIVEPRALASELAAPSAAQPKIVCVGFRLLYDSHHIPGAILAGPASQPDGIRALQDAMKNVPRNTPVVLYCGCCPWKDCPNIRPGFQTMRSLGFTHVRVLALPRSFQHDWVAKGLPTARGGR